MYTGERMRKKHLISRGLTILLIVLVPAAILLLSSAVILHMPQPYEYYFNDSQSLEGIGYGITVSEMGEEISDYFRLPTDAPFQVFERNGEYEDPVFSELDQRVMKKAADFLWRETILGVVLTILSILFFWNAKRRKLTDLLRPVCWAASVLTVLLLILQVVLLSSEAFRQTLYRHVIGIPIPKTSNLYVILGSGEFAGVYLMFASVLSAALLILFIYIFYKNTRPERVFYVRKRFQ